MNGYDLLDAVGAIDEKYVAEASAAKKNTGKRWVRWGALAACLCIIAGGVYLAVRPHYGVMDTSVPVPADASEVKPAPIVPAPVPAEEGSKPDGRGLYIPAIELPENSEGEMDMIALIVYRGAIYTQSEYYMGGDAAVVDGLVGEYLGTSDGSINEWSSREEYGRDYAGSIPGDFYAVKGYDPDFRICLRQEVTDENGKPGLFIQFLDHMNGIRLETGEDLYESRLHLRGRVGRVDWQYHDDWDYNRGNIRTAELEPGQWEEFLDAVCAGEFVYVWDPDSDFYEGVPRSSIYSTPNQAHLFLRLDDGTTVRLRLIEGGYVGFDGPAGVWYFVKIPGESFDAMYDSCGGSHETGWTIQGK